MTMENFKGQKSCCSKSDSKGERKGILKGILYGLAPHTFCILFIIFSILGATTVTTLLKPLLLNRYFFYLLIILSLVLATISAIIYLKKNGILSFQGMKRKWKYLSILYGTTVFVNLLLFLVIFPIATNLNSGSSLKSAILGAFSRNEMSQLAGSQSSMTLQVEIPCPGHAPLITGELKKINGVEDIKFRFPNLFDINYNSEKTSKAQILSLDVFRTYKATVIDEKISQTNNPQPQNNPEQPPGNIGGCAAGCGGSCGGCGCGCRR